jgi:hypothetical protein
MRISFCEIKCAVNCLPHILYLKGVKNFLHTFEYWINIYFNKVSKNRKKFKQWNIFFTLPLRLATQWIANMNNNLMNMSSLNSSNPGVAGNFRSFPSVEISVLIRLHDSIFFFLIWFLKLTITIIVWIFLFYTAFTINLYLHKLYSCSSTVTVYRTSAFTLV